MTSVVCVRGEESRLGELKAKAQEGLAGPAKLIVAFVSSKIPLLPVLGSLEEAFPDAVVLGSTTSGEFTGEGDGTGTVSLFALGGDYIVHAGLGTGLGASPEATVAMALAGQPRELVGYRHRTGIILLDPLAGHGEEAALLVANELGSAPLVGGAAGDDLAMQKTWIGIGSRVASDAIVVATIFSRAPLGIGVKHGHDPLFAKGLTVTRADGSVVLEIDGRPAWDVWRELSGDRAKSLGLDPEAHPGAYLLRFEAGLRIGHEYKVRAPLAPKPGGGILFATPMPEGTVFNIMESDASAQVDSAVAAAEQARSALGGSEVAGALVFDCICRKLILGDGYAPMLARVAEQLGGAPLAGFETYGEVAMNSGDMSGFHNTTTVVLAFPKDESGPSGGDHAGG